MPLRRQYTRAEIGESVSVRPREGDVTCGVDDEEGPGPRASGLGDPRDYPRATAVSGPSLGLLLSAVGRLTSDSP